ncbi:hypothetical protein [Streptomyces sp. NPDC088719]|uniref:hypothetical protein n=1 Tax=Streptomyces sp. NPDC088719 TaxID=3365872 RepID=UPI0038194BF0
MIASTPIAQWNWGARGYDTDLIHEAVRRFSAALEVLDRHHLGTPHSGQVSVKIPEPEHRGFLTQQKYPATSGLLGAIEESARTGSIGGVEMLTSCDGVLETEDGPLATEGLFNLSVDVSESYFTVALATFSDAWMQYDLKGKENDSLFRLNRPRLAELLKGLSEALGTEVEPDDPTRLGIATEEGVDNHFDDDGSASNVWIRFEIPQRNNVFSHTPPFQSTYKREATGRVSYLPVHGENEILGYLWASEAEGAASFEPRDDADMAGYHAGLAWLEKLHEAFERGLAPSAALESFRDSPADRASGHVVGESPTATIEFWALRRMASE